MTDKELILQALSDYSCVTAQELSNYIKRTYKKSFSSAFIINVLKKYINENKVTKSNCGIGTHYWVI